MSNYVGIPKCCLCLFSTHLFWPLKSGANTDSLTYTWIHLIHY